jgi:hypothetical protein
MQHGSWLQLRRSVYEFFDSFHISAQRIYVTNWELIVHVSQRFFKYLYGYDPYTLQLYNLLDFQQPRLYESEWQSNGLFFGATIGNLYISRLSFSLHI